LFCWPIKRWPNNESVAGAATAPRKMVKSVARLSVSLALAKCYMLLRSVA